MERIILLIYAHAPALSFFSDGVADVKRKDVFTNKGQNLIEKRLRHLTERFVVA